MSAAIRCVLQKGDLTIKLNFFNFLKQLTMKKAFFILIFLLYATFGFAQHAINQTLIDYFDNLDKSQVPTGILVEQGFPMYDLEMYKGVSLDGQQQG